MSKEFKKGEQVYVSPVAISFFHEMPHALAGKVGTYVKETLPGKHILSSGDYNYLLEEKYLLPMNLSNNEQALGLLKEDAYG